MLVNYTPGRCPAGAAALRGRPPLAWGPAVSPPQWLGRLGRAGLSAAVRLHVAIAKTSLSWCLRSHLGRTPRPVHLTEKGPHAQLPGARPCWGASPASVPFQTEAVLCRRGPGPGPPPAQPMLARRSLQGCNRGRCCPPNPQRTGEDLETAEVAATSASAGSRAGVPCAEAPGASFSPRVAPGPLSCCSLRLPVPAPCAQPRGLSGTRRPSPGPQPWRTAGPDLRAGSSDHVVGFSRADTVISSFPVSSGDPEHVLHQAGNG